MPQPRKVKGHEAEIRAMRSAGLMVKEIAQHFGVRPDAICAVAGPLGRYQSVSRRFWEKVQRLSDDDCWLWQGSTGHSGYGRMSVEGRLVDAHRVAWQLAHGPIPDELEVLHSCDNKLCVNDAHLHLGTQQVNMQEWHDRHHVRPCRLTASETGRLLALYRSGQYSQEKLGQMFGITQTMVSHIVLGKVYQRYELAAARHVGEPSVTIRGVK